MEIANKVFIVTGGASGLGAGTVRMLVANGAKVVIADVQDEPGQALAKELNQRYVHCDVTQEADGKQAVAAAVELGPLFGLVNCAGVAPAAKIVGKNGAHPLDLFQKVVSINLIGSFNMMRLAAEAMSANTPESTGERGVLINTASVAAFDGQIGQAAYAASKAGVAGMTLPIARDLSKTGIRCMTIAPGIFGTPMIFGMPQEVQDSLAASIPFPARLAARKTTPGWCTASSPTICSTAKRSASTARSGCRPSNPSPRRAGSMPARCFGTLAFMALLRSAATVSSFTLLSRITGLVRDILVARAFGAGPLTDAFWVAFRIPNLLRRLFAEGAFAQAFVPILGAARTERSDAEVRTLLDRVAVLLTAALMLVTLAGVVAAPWVVTAMASGLRSAERGAEFGAAVWMTRVMFPYILCMSLIAFASGVLNTWRRFAVPAFTPVLLNLAMIAACLWLAPRMDVRSTPWPWA